VGFVPRLRIPSVVVMIAAGIVFGSSGVSLIQLDGPVQILALLGLAFLLFLPAWRLTFGACGAICCGLRSRARRLRWHSVASPEWCSVFWIGYAAHCCSQ